MRSFVLFIVFVAFLAAPAQGQTDQPAHKDIEPFPELSRVHEFYKGIGIAELKTLSTSSLQAARDTAYSQAYKMLAESICNVYLERDANGVVQVKTTAKWTLPAGLRRSREKWIGDMLWVRAWVYKQEADKQIDKICLNPRPADQPAP